MILQEREIRKTDQYELPVVKNNSTQGYDIYPVHSIGANKIFEGFDSLAKELSNCNCIKLDGYVGILFEDIKVKLSKSFDALNLNFQWINLQDALLSEEQIQKKATPFLGEGDPVFGKVCSLKLLDFFDTKKLKDLTFKHSENSLIIYYGIGASSLPIEGKTVYFDISKNEIQFRSRAGIISNLGSRNAADPKEMYKRFYFIDWVVLNKYLNEVKNNIDVFVDGQRSEDITWTSGNIWRNSLKEISKHPVRVRPWFEPGAWGGEWIKKNIDRLEKNVVNYAWSFELIVPENGLILESSGLMLETTFNSLMFVSGKNILGNDFAVYQYDFPIRFDFLDTFNGGNLSIQCHPQVSYIQKHFGEKITQEETYYILDNQENAKVYLGFQADINPDDFRKALEKSQIEGKAIDIKQYVQEFDAEKHSLYLIPPGTIHSSGVGNLVLEISSTPYIYTFKMYDWLRLDLDGKPRPLNIDRGMDNLVFERSGERVKEELISKPVLIEQSASWQLYHLPTHQQHLYDVHRYVIFSEVIVETEGKAHVLSVVDGLKVEVIDDNKATTFAFAETFIIPAATKRYTIKNLTKEPVMVIKAFIK